MSISNPSDLHTLPLEKLIKKCGSSQNQSDDPHMACCELLCHALCDHNDAAWDAVVIYVRPYILAWIYESALETTPTNAQLLVYRTLQEFRASAMNVHFADTFPDFNAILLYLRQNLERLLG